MGLIYKKALKLRLDAIGRLNFAFAVLRSRKVEILRKASRGYCWLLSNRVLLGLLALVIFFVLLSGNSTQAQVAKTPSPMFRHDLQHTGRSHYIGPDTPALKWSFITGGPVISSPAIVVLMVPYTWAPMTTSSTL